MRRRDHGNDCRCRLTKQSFELATRKSLFLFFFHLACMTFADRSLGMSEHGMT